MRRLVSKRVSGELTAEQFAARIMALQSDEELHKHRRYFNFDPDNQPADDYFIGVRMGRIFELSKEYMDMPVAGIEELLESPIHEIRVGALSVMGQRAKTKGCTPERLEDLYNLYIRRHDRINNWDLVDLAAYYVVGRYLADKPRDVLYKLARSEDRWERRTSILATAHFILRQGQVDDTFKLAEMLIDDPEDLVNKGTGWMLRTAGDKDRKRLLEFLDRFAPTMPRVTLRYAIEKLDAAERKYYLGLKSAG
jgi:3-methyladenine DNA glycosylase AlkD